jgi:hypothetical protein
MLTTPHNLKLKIHVNEGGIWKWSLDYHTVLMNKEHLFKPPHNLQSSTWSHLYLHHTSEVTATQQQIQGTTLQCDDGGAQWVWQQLTNTAFKSSGM